MTPQAARKQRLNGPESTSARPLDQNHLDPAPNGPTPPKNEDLAKKTSHSMTKAELYEKVAKIPSLYVKVYRKAMTGKSKAAGIKAKCLDCCCWQRKEVELCPAPDCPLYPYRPYRKGAEHE